MTQDFQSLGSERIDHQHTNPKGGVGANVASIPPDKTGQRVSLQREWAGGPLRNWSATKTTRTPLGHARGGFVGSYACDLCLRTCDGVYWLREAQRWLCGACKNGLPKPNRRNRATPSQKSTEDSMSAASPQSIAAQGPARERDRNVTNSEEEKC